MLLGELNEAAAASSESSGVGSGGGNWMLVRSGSEPPVLWAAGFSTVVSCWSGDGKMLQETTKSRFQNGAKWLIDVRDEGTETNLAQPVQN